MRATGEQPGEQMMDTSNEPTGPTIDENLVNQLVEMGYPYHASRKALYHTSQQLEVHNKGYHESNPNDDFRQRSNG